MLRLFKAMILAGGLAAVSAFGSDPGPPRRVAAVPAPAAPAAPVELEADLAALYRDRGFQPLWVESGRISPDAHKAASLLQDGELHAALAAAQDGERRQVARADLLLSRAVARRLKQAHRPPVRKLMRYIDAELEPEARPAAQLIQEAAAAPSLEAHLRALLFSNPALVGLEQGLRDYRARWSGLKRVGIPAGPTLSAGASGDRVRRLRARLGLSGDGMDAALRARLIDFQRVHGLPPTGQGDGATIAALNRPPAHYEKIIRANIERARAIPARPGARYLLVDAASAQLWMVEDGRIVDRMKVIVGKNGMQTPALAGLIRYAAFNPYWNLPPDLIRERARRVLRRGHSVLAAEKMETLSDWSDDARRLSPREVDWKAVASGRKAVNMRQRPGPHNMMGAVKFMLPNDLGIYLHDTPSRGDFARSDRRISSGCVRVEDANRLAQWLFGGHPPKPGAGAEQQIDLPEPIPVYITYLTVRPTRDGLVFGPDPYRRDPSLLRQLDSGSDVTA